MREKFVRIHRYSKICFYQVEQANVVVSLIKNLSKQSTRLLALVESNENDLLDCSCKKCNSFREANVQQLITNSINAG